MILVHWEEATGTSHRPHRVFCVVTQDLIPLIPPALATEPTTWLNKVVFYISDKYLPLLAEDSLEVPPANGYIHMCVFSPLKQDDCTLHPTHGVKHNCLCSTRIQGCTMLYIGVSGFFSRNLQLVRKNINSISECWLDLIVLVEHGRALLDRDVIQSVVLVLVVNEACLSITAISAHYKSGRTHKV